MVSNVTTLYLLLSLAPMLMVLILEGTATFALIVLLRSGRVDVMQMPALILAVAVGLLVAILAFVIVFGVSLTTLQQLW